MGEEEKACRGHVMVLPFPVQGHINPMLHLSKRLASKGLKVTLATTFLTIESMKVKAGPVTMESFANGQLSIEPFSDGSEDGGTDISGDGYIEQFETVGSKNLIELIEKQNRSGYPVKCLVYDALIPWALSLAKQLELMGAAFYTQSSSVNAIYYQVYKGLLPTPVEGPTLISIPGLPLLETHDLPSFVYNIDAYPSFLSIVLGQCSNVDEADWLLVTPSVLIC